MRATTALLIVASIGLTICGSAIGSSEPRASTPTPVQCLKTAGLSGVRALGEDSWRAFHSQPFFTIGVRRWDTESAARAALTGVSPHTTAAQAGRYVVTGAGKQVVTSVADCLDGKQAKPGPPPPPVWPN